MKKIQFIFGIHNHQPVGNFDDVFHFACDKSYIPFMDVLEKHPSISMAIHFTGSLIEWLDIHRPEVMAQLKRLVQRGNIELLGAGFYEPILSMIPNEDKVGQIKMMRQYFQDKFHYDIHGSWLTERVWEPHLVQPIADSGIQYVVVDDYHFSTAGIPKEDLTGYYLTEENGQRLGVFPISQELRYKMPFEDPQATIDELRKHATEEGNNVLVMADDGEKFGLWPQTYETVYEQKWLDRFFTALEDNSDWIKTTTFKNYYTTQHSRGLVYLPTASYFEMSQWTLPAKLGIELESFVHELEDENKMEKLRPFVRGGMWRNFFTKYEEANWMQKRMQSVSNRVRDAKPLLTEEQFNSATDAIYHAQCNCGYWHGVFGGLYLPHLRHGLYENILKAEKILNSLDAEHKIQTKDIDFDGANEIQMTSETLQLFLQEKGGIIREIDYLPAHFNVSNTLRRYGESYHHKLALANNDDTSGKSIHDIILTKEKGLQDKLFVDALPRFSFQDHFLALGELESDFYRGCLAEQSDFYKQRFESDIMGSSVQFSAAGRVHNLPFQLKKSVSLKDDEIALSVTILNQSTETYSGVYGMEFNFGLLGGNSPDRYYDLPEVNKTGETLNTQSTDKGITKIALIDEWDNLKINLSWDKPAEMIRAPIETISMSEAGFERIYQASSLLWNTTVQINPNEELSFNFKIKITSFK